MRNLMNLRMKPYGMLVLGVDVGPADGPADGAGREWDARLDMRWTTWRWTT